MEKKYNAKDIFIALLISCAYILVWFAVQYVVIFTAELILILSNPNDIEKAISIIFSNSLLITAFCNILTVLIICLFFKIRSKSVRERVNLHNAPQNVLLSSFLLGLGAQIMVIIILSRIPMPESWTQTHNENYSSVSAFSLVSILTVVFIAPIVEEFIFRGLVLNRLCRKMPPWVAIIISAFAFGAVHGEIYAFIYAFLVGILMGWIFIKFDSVIPTMLFHIGFNGLSLLLSLFIDLPMLQILLIFGGVALFVYEMVCIIRYPKISNVPIEIIPEMPNENMGQNNHFE